MIFIVLTFVLFGVLYQAVLANSKKRPKLPMLDIPFKEKRHYCLTDLSVDSNDITALVSGQQKHYFHLWGLQKPLVAFATRDFFRPHS
jgi:hypothetical protein